MYVWPEMKLDILLIHSEKTTYNKLTMNRLTSLQQLFINLGFTPTDI